MENTINRKRAEHNSVSNIFLSSTHMNTNLQHDELEALSLRSTTDDLEEIRLELRDKARKSTYFIGKAVIGFKDMTPLTHGPMCRFIESSSKRKQGLAPRDHLKTSVWTIADTVRRIVENPNIRILLANETSTNASHFLRKIQSIFERCTILKWLFPECIPDLSKRTKWNETEMCIPRSVDFPESTVEVIGVGGAVVSRHYDLIKCDDLVGKEASESEDVMRKTIDWYQYCESLLNHPVDGEIQNYGTRWGYADLHRWVVENEPGVEIFHRTCYLDDAGEPTTDPVRSFWPERFTMEALLRIRMKMGPYKFSCQYLNDPRDPDANSFLRDWLRYFTLSGPNCVLEGEGISIPWRSLRRQLRVDPAVKEDDKACEWAICVDGVDKDSRKILLETWTGHVNPLEAFEKIFELSARWEVDRVGMEDVGAQRHLMTWLKQEMLRRGKWLTLVPLKADTTKSKKSRIRSVQPYFARGEVYIQRTEHKFISQYEEFPSGKLVDLLDVFAYGPDMWGLPELDGDDSALESVEHFREMTFMGRNGTTGY